MLYAFGFERIGVVVSDIYFVDPNPVKGQEGAERGVRLEVRMLDRGELKGSIYSAQPIEVGQPIWRVDLLESVAGPPGSFDRTHHHPAFRELGARQPGVRRGTVGESTRVARRSAQDLEGVLERAGVSPDETTATGGGGAPRQRDRRSSARRTDCSARCRPASSAGRQPTSR